MRGFTLKTTTKQYEQIVAELKKKSVKELLHRVHVRLACLGTDHLIYLDNGPSNFLTSISIKKKIWLATILIEQKNLASILPNVEKNLSEKPFSAD